MGRGLIVLDTHAAIWFAAGMKMRRPAMSAIESALAADGVILSTISGWEIGMLIAKQRLIVSGNAADYIHALFRSDGIIEEPVSSEIAIRAAFLPDDFYGDPADRMIVATAVVRKASLVTRDERILAYLRKTRLTPYIAC
ncbi:MAG: type II toxin-antitoxin system VapC family toxin [Candidatus Velthaea sp.]